MDENLFTAARRLCRFINVDLNHGGLLSEDTERALVICEREIEKLRQKEKANDQSVPAPVE